MFTPDFEMSFLNRHLKEKKEWIKGLLELAHSCYGLSLY